MVVAKGATVSILEEQVTALDLVRPALKVIDTEKVSKILRQHLIHFGDEQWRTSVPKQS